MACRYLAYKDESDDQMFEHERPYCEAASMFVQPLRADICNDTGSFSPAEHCEIYREAENIE